ncbi:MAG: hypothetical protein NTY09_09255 [bacterium]|nr:hypothetical protein [bacterium]
MACYYRYFTLYVIAAIIMAGCSGKGSQPVIPDNEPTQQALTGSPDAVNDQTGNHYLLAYNFIYIDPYSPDGPKFEVIPAREGEIHLNILKLLEVGPCPDCFKVVGFNFPQPGYLDLDIEIDHPYDYLDFSVFDVRGIIMFQGNHEFPAIGKSISDPILGDGAVLNPDGYTALYNGSTMTAPTGDYQKYFQGKLATFSIPDSDINGYRYFVTDDPENDRNAFYAGTSDVQTYNLKLPTGSFIIGYAVDASWAPPFMSPVDDPLTDFEFNANCIEPWKIVVSEQHICDGLTDIGGQTKLLIDVYDWPYNSDYYGPVVECPEFFDGTFTSKWDGGGAGYHQFKAIISNDKLAPAGTYTCLVVVKDEENNPIDTPWLDLTAYQIYNVEVIEALPPGPGHLIWAKRAGGADIDRGYGITTLSDDSTVVTGHYSESATFGEGEPNETVLTMVNSGIFIARYNPDGTLQWAKRAGGNGADYAYAITALSDNSTVVTGQFKNSATFGEGEANETVLVSGGYTDIFIARYNPDGTLAWAKRAGGNSSCCGYAIAPLSDNSTVVTGWFSDSYGPTTFGPGEPNETILTSAGDLDTFIACYNPDGTLQWAKRAGGPDGDMGYAITALSDNSTVVTGIFESWARFGPGEPNETILLSNGILDFFIAQFNPDGTLKWAKSAGGSHSDKCNGITALSDDSMVVTGTFTDSIIFGVGEPNETTLTANGTNIFIARYNPDGTLVWAKNGASHYVKPYGITTLLDDSIVVTGDFQNSTTFGLGEPNETELESAGYWDIFVAGYSQDGTFLWVKQAGGLDTNDYYEECGQGITALSDNSTVVTGKFYGSATFGICDPFNTVLTSAGDADIFIARYAE